MSTKNYPDGIDCVWLASDVAGHVGAFITAGLGPIPSAALDEKMLPIEDVEASLCELPQSTHAKLLVSVKRPDDFVALAERGIFVYDWTDIGRTAANALHRYELVAAPVQPIFLDKLPHELFRLAKAAELSKISFLTDNSLDIRKHLSFLS